MKHKYKLLSVLCFSICLVNGQQRCGNGDHSQCKYSGCPNGECGLSGVSFFQCQAYFIHVPTSCPCNPDIKCSGGQYKDSYCNCLPCTPNFYCPGTNSRISCPANSVSLASSSSVTQCTANAGYYRAGAEVVPCQTSTYCPAGSTNESLCAQNFYCPNTTAQLPCPNNCPANATQQACPVGYTSPVGSSDVSQCTAVCTGPCTSPGTYESAPCTDTSDKTCSPCTNLIANAAYTGVGTTSTDCPWVCNPKYYLDNDVCQPCPADHWCSGNIMNTCPINSASPALSDAQNQCLCKPGYYGNGSRTGTSPCPICTVGNYCPGGNTNLSLSCPENFTSDIGADEVSDCYCKPGYELESGRCQLCRPGAFCMSGTLSMCPDNSFSPTGSNEITDCVCNPGFYGANGGPCYQCPADSYCPGGLVAIGCTAHAVSPVQSTNASACYCDRGYVGVANQPCEPCPAGTWCWTGILNVCPTNTSSPPMSNYWRNCTCMPGFTGPDGLACAPCAPGTYKSYNGSDECALCPLNTYCPQQSLLPTACPPDSFCNGIVAQTCSPPCAAGLFEEVCTSTSDRYCSDCPFESFCDGPIATPCRDPCNLDEKEDVPCTSTTDRVCSACPEGSFCNGIQSQTCRGPCAQDQLQIVPCTNTTDRVCIACLANSYCDGLVARTCTSPCAQSQKQDVDCTSTTDRVCSECPVEMYCDGLVSHECTEPCAPGFTETTPCTSTTNRVCTPCPNNSYCVGNDIYPCTQPCATNQHQTQDCTPTKNRVCESCPSEMYCNGLNKTQCIQCHPGTYETSPCTDVSNRVCSDCLADSYCLGGAAISTCRSVCSAGSYETTQCTSTTNRVCTSCPDSSFCLGNTHVQACRSGCSSPQYESTACTNSTDRVCSDCPDEHYCLNGVAKNACTPRCGAEFFETTPCTNVSNRICTACKTRCTADEYEDVACTEFSDRVCKPLKKDIAIQFAVAAPAIELTPTVLESYSDAVAESMGIDPAYVTASLTPPEQSRRRRLLQSDQKIYFIIRIPAANITEVVANITVSNQTEIPDVTQIMETLVTQVQSTTFQEVLAQNIAEAQLVAVVVDTTTVVSTIIKELPPNCPTGKFCVGSDIYDCSGPCPRGSYQTKACNAAADQVCSPCPQGQFCLGGLHRQPCANCSSGMLLHCIAVYKVYFIVACYLASYSFRALCMHRAICCK
jgi:hypothetical protein